MKVVGIHTSPNEDGLCAGLTRTVLRGAEEAGADTQVVRIHEYDLESCRTCGEGWGSCLSKGQCDIPDRFQEIRELVNDADAVVFCTPVYFADLSEDAKCILDRWRRCEIHDREHSPLKGKPVVGIVVAGGGGGGCVQALHNLERYLSMLQFSTVDLVPVTKRSLPWREAGLEAAGRSLAGGE